MEQQTKHTGFYQIKQLSVIQKAALHFIGDQYKWLRLYFAGFLHCS